MAGVRAVQGKRHMNREIAFQLTRAYSQLDDDDFVYMTLVRPAEHFDWLFNDDHEGSRHRLLAGLDVITRNRKFRNFRAAKLTKEERAWLENLGAILCLARMAVTLSRILARAGPVSCERSKCYRKGLLALRRQLDLRLQPAKICCPEGLARKRQRYVTLQAGESSRLRNSTSSTVKARA